ncbi:uncharacterized protein LOC116429123 isoform X2 [Nomia melanderi]|uniref:uncharacterized protein LOC116429123 isoform X2 n=1 Tax=Nomia melanderi TaxID=2448451 RepID=UPI0013045BDA|nr:uncharacterized protein LOC116429123 isoform X2 [Nomia melanderi]
MFKGYNIIAFFFICKYLSVTGQNDCDIICDTSDCKTITNNSNITLTTNEYSNVDFCKKEDIPNTVNFTVEDGDETSIYPAILNISFTLPRRKCMYSLILLANEFINEKDCATYNFENLYDMEVHSSKRIMCFFPNSTHYLERIDNMSFPYIFKACYNVQFNYGQDKYVNIKKFLKTNYKRTEVTHPQFKCTYESLHDSTKGDILHFNIILTVSLVSKVILNLSLLDNLNGQEVCDGNNLVSENSTWSFKVLEDYKNNKSNTVMLSRKEYVRNLQYNITPVGKVDYCILTYFIDRRCKINSLWRPPENACAVYKNCNLVFNQNGGPTTTNKINISIFLYWILIGTLLSIIAMFVIIYFIYITNICICRKKFCRKKKQEKVYKSLPPIRTDVVLLYSKDSESFMALMAEFRENLRKVCQCSVHDWYDAMECNNVAMIGGSEWFTEILNKGFHIIWVDTPTARLLITQRFRDDFIVKNCNEDNFVKICDFRDIVFPTIFDLAKRNIDHSISPQNKHFIVRVKGFEIFGTENDPFLNLCLHRRYTIPHDLNLLYSDLSLLE